MEHVLEMAVIIYLIVINIIGFLMMAVDKQKSRKHKWRIREAAFFLVALLLGSVGTWAGMYAFRHKTKHWYFVIGMPVILFAQIAVAVFVIFFR